MNFVYPQFLWALLAIALPILIHIFNFRRVRKVYFSNVALLKEVKTSTNTFRRLKELLILLSRIAFITALVLAFAQPYIPSKNQGSIENLSGVVSIYLDNSFSMQNEIDNESYLSWAMNNINQLTKVFPEKARFQLITNQFENIEQYPISSSALEDRLSETTFSSAFRDFNMISKRQNTLLKRHTNPKEKQQVFWFADFQKSTSGNLNKLELDSTQQYYIIPLKTKSTANLMVDSVWLANPFVKSLESNKLSVRVSNFGEETYENLVLKFMIDERQVSSTTVSIEGKSSQVGGFNFTIDGRGQKKGKIVFEDFPITFDNTYYFVLNVAPKINILYLNGEQKNRYIENLYTNEEVFDLQSQSANNLDLKRIKKADVLVLENVLDTEGEFKNALQSFVKRGGTILVFPPANPQDNWKSFFAELGIGGVQTLGADSTSGGSENAKLLPPNIQNPFYQGIFESIPINMEMPSATPIWRWNNAGNNILLFKDKRPFLSEFKVQQGRVYICASPLDRKFSSFARNAIFVPILYKIASTSKTVGERLAYSFQEKNISIKIEKPAQEGAYKLVKDDVAFIPAQRLSGKELILEIPNEAFESGFYELKQGEKTEHIFAFNYGKEESKMDFYSMEELQSIFKKYPNVQVFDLKDQEAFIQDFRERNLQINLWKYMLLLALIFFLTEIALIRFLK